MTNIVMLCHNRLRLLEQALRTLAQNTPAEEVTVTLVDDCSSDFRVRRLLEVYAARQRWTCIRIEKSEHVLARAKNTGVYWSEQTFGRGDWLYLSDSDVAFLPGWLGMLIQTAEASEPRGYKLWGGQIHPYHLPVHEPKYEPDGSQVFHVDFGKPGDGNARWTEHQVLDGPSWLMRWSTWDLVGPLDPYCAPGTCQGEDGGWCDRLRASGGRIGVVHPHVIAHTGLTNTSGADAPGRAEREAQMIPGILYE